MAAPAWQRIGLHCGNQRAVSAHTLRLVGERSLTHRGGWFEAGGGRVLEPRRLRPYLRVSYPLHPE